MHYKSLAIIGILLSASIFNSYSQCPTAAYTAAGPVCAGQPISFSNQSTGAVSYEWDFCAGDFYGANSSFWDTTGLTTTPSCATPVIDGSDSYVFLCSRDDNRIIRVDFANGFDNPASGVADLGSPFGAVSSPNGIAFHKQGNTWYALVNNIFNNNISLLTFGNGLDNMPTLGVVVPTTTVTFPRGIDLTISPFGNILVVIANNTNHSISMLDFGNNITNIPTEVNYPLTTGTNPIDVSFVKDCNNNAVFVSCYSNSIVRIDFGNSFSNIPSAMTALNNTTLSNPSGISVVNDLGEWIICVMNNVNGKLQKYRLGPDLLNNNPDLLGDYSFGGGNPMGVNMIKSGSKWFAFSNSESLNRFHVMSMEDNCSSNQATSNQQNPSGIVFSTDGAHYIALSATDASGYSAHFGDSVYVAVTPVTIFSVSNTCFGELTLFTDSSSISAGVIQYWHWDFGDGDTSNVQHPTHFYSTSGSYTVSLTTYANSGCSNTTVANVNITPKPTAGFLAPSGCSDVLLPFTDQSTLSSGSIVSWSWNFGNGDTSASQNPLYAYPDGGAYQVQLTVLSDAGCSDSTTQSITINDSPDGNFTASNTCVGQLVNFTDQTQSQVGVISYTWDFGDGNNSSTQHPSHTYLTAIPAVYTVSLVVLASNGCNDTVSFPVKINNIPSANFNFAPSNVCEGNNVTFNDLSVVSGDTISKWLWDFGDGTTDSLMNPIHQYASSGTYQVNLISYSPSNCPSAVFSQNVNVIESPTANFGYSNVCLGQLMNFTDLSSAPTGSTIINRSWDFAGLDTSNLINPSYLFNNPGIHQVILTVTTDFGCMNSDTALVNVYTPPAAGFTFQNACSDYPTVFTNTSAADSASFITLYQWNFGDPNSGSNNFSNLLNPTHTYDSSALGFHTVILTVENNFGCRDSVFQILNVKPSVIPRFSYSPTCYGDLMVFTNFSLNTNLDSLWIWNFGDNQTNQLMNPAHYYAFPGTYQVTLTAISTDGCVSSASKQVVVSPIPVANFATTPACIKNPYAFVETATISAGNIVRWDWTINNLATFDSVKSPVIVFDTVKTYSVKLVVKSDIGCVDSVTKSISVNPLPVPNFSFNPQYGNPPLSVFFTNLTNNTSTNSYSWSFGDGSGSSSQTNPVHDYLDTGRFVIKLIATSGFGCKDSIQKSIYVIRPVLDVAVTDISAMMVNNKLTINASLANLGTIDIDSVIMQARLQDGTTIQETYRQLIPNGSGGIQNYQFVASFNVPPTSQLGYYCVKAIKPNNQQDDVDGNNEKCKNLINEIAIIEPYPNPFNEVLNLNVVVPFEDYITIEFYDNIGKKINTLYDGISPAGLNNFSFDMSDLLSGIYSVRISFRDQELIRHVVKQSLKKQ